MSSITRRSRMKAIVATAALSGAALLAVATPASASTATIGGGTPTWWNTCEVSNGLCLFYTANGTGAAFKTGYSWIANFDGSWNVYGESGTNYDYFSTNSTDGQSNGSGAQVRNAAHSAANNWNADGLNSCLFVSPNFTGNEDIVVSSGNLDYTQNNEASYYTC
jgi:hypothetical protein